MRGRPGQRRLRRISFGCARGFSLPGGALPKSHAIVAQASLPAGERSIPASNLLFAAFPPGVHTDLTDSQFPPVNDRARCSSHPQAGMPAPRRAALPGNEEAVSSAEGAALYQPGAKPQELTKSASGLKARTILEGEAVRLIPIERAFSPHACDAQTWDCVPGWYRSHLRCCGSAAKNEVSLIFAPSSPS